MISVLVGARPRTGRAALQASQMEISEFTHGDLHSAVSVIHSTHKKHHMLRWILAATYNATVTLRRKGRECHAATLKDEHRDVVAHEQDANPARLALAEHGQRRI